MSYILDRRLNGKNKSTVNRQRFLRRYRSHIKKAVQDAINDRSITDLARGEKISIPNKDIHEPTFGQGSGGQRHRIFPGNKEFIAGDTIDKPKQGGGGAGSGQASDQGEGEDEFSFYINREEFLEYIFSDLALPNLLKKKLANLDSFTYRRAGYTTSGTPNNISIIRSMRSAHARRIALSSKKRRLLKEDEAELNLLLKLPPQDRNNSRVEELREEIAHLKKRISAIPFIDEFDIKYRAHVKQPNPTTKAVMFCVMDVSGSMTQSIKEIAKRFYILLYLFLQRNYKKIELVFIRHHTSAKEVDEEEFFYSRETGGTIVSSALELMAEIIEKRYNTADWNIYAAQASDGDNWDDDSPRCKNLLQNNILPLVQYFAYIEITPDRHQALWRAYEELQAENKDYFAMQQISSAEDIYPVFRELFAQKDQTQEA